MVKPRVGIIKRRSFGPGGIQTCCLELAAGLNRLGITPDVLWDEPTDWAAFADPVPEMGFHLGKLPICSARLRDLPAGLESRLRPLSIGLARLGLERYDFVYSFEPYARMPTSPPNLCWLTGPYHLELPDPMGDDDGHRALGPWRTLISKYLGPRRLRPDPNARYVCHADWIAELFLKEYGVRVPVVWPPIRSRKTKPVQHREGFLFFSRLIEAKRPHTMLALARRYPAYRFTLAGSPSSLDDPYFRALATSVSSQAHGNVRLVLNPADDEVSQLFADHEFFIFPARWEHFGMVSVEAIQAGLTPLVHDSGGQREIVPIDTLRFKGETDLVEKAGALLSTTPSDRRDMLVGLQRHAARGSPERYCREMILPLCREWSLTYPEK